MNLILLAEKAHEYSKKTGRDVIITSNPRHGSITFFEGQTQYTLDFWDDGKYEARKSSEVITLGEFVKELES